MFPKELFEMQVADLDAISNGGGEHYRYGAFQWWITRVPSQDQVCKLIALTFLDADQVMAAAARMDMLEKLDGLSENLKILLRLR